MKHVLLVEDERHKQEELSGYLQDYIQPKLSLDVVQSVREAVLAVGENDYDLIVLDMALPTFTTGKETSDGGRDQALGGVEVLRTLNSIKKCALVVIVTQYPDISLEGKRVKLRFAQNALAKKYNQKIAGALLYKYKSSQNGPKLKSIIEAAW